MDERHAHAAWVKAVEMLGHLVGYTAYEEVISYYIWKGE
jgi:hypothetical protein